MTVRELADELKAYPGEAEIVVVRVSTRGKKYPDRIEAIRDGADLCGYDKEFAGKSSFVVRPKGRKKGK